MKLLKIGVVILLTAMVASGCSSKGGTKEEGENGASGTGAGGPEIGKYGDGSSGAYGSGGYGASSSQYGSGGQSQYGSTSAGGGQYGEAALDDPGSPLSKRVIYFMYDSSDVQPEYVPVINNHASFLASNPSKNVVLEGHADERGSPEYNVALGEQRAKSVAKMMKLQGVAENQIQVVSFGEEKPAVSGHDDAAWQQNRRVELAYPGH